jgi:ribonuclease HII
MRFGADEAGKGPVLGSMFAAAVAAPADAIPDGVADSKQLAPERREALDAELRADDRVAVAVAEVPVDRIDDPESDMNTLTVAAQADAVAAVSEAGMAGVVDAGDTSEDRFARRLADRVPHALDLTAEHAADDEHPIVAAASIVAKVARDAHVAAIDDHYDADVGSGYPSDPTTREFLAEHVERHGELPACARRSWSTCEDVLAAAEQSSLDAF